MRTHDYSVTIRPKDKSAADEYTHKGKTYIEGRHNSAYVIDLINHSAHRVEAVVSVDGLAITDGQPASYRSKGFVVAAYETVTLKGWLVNHTQAAQFVFGDKRDSYSQKSGAKTSTGIIGVAWFPELLRAQTSFINNSYTPWHVTHTTVIPTRDWLTLQPQNICDVHQPLSAQVLRGSMIGASMSKQVASASVSQQGALGTQFGESVSYPTTQTAFERAAAEPQAVSMIYYDHAQNLTRMGIRLKPRTLPYADAFPGNTAPAYCEPPPGWTHKKW
jgi:hypothetical protein